MTETGTYMLAVKGSGLDWLCRPRSRPRHLGQVRITRRITTNIISKHNQLQFSNPTLQYLVHTTDQTRPK